ncbi:hypothetical protein FOZ60_005600 [Perkinsus olseni]|uniref:Uncharacterized protein n=1 Tax=Perkinsus olseni TaxID=32597 RepID=A0A7J6NRF2_PEROL|nr:hypothetical protein FOZ60_005600 [Perkinsus olseni]
MRALMHLLSFSILLQLVTSLQPTKKERRPYPRPSSTTLKPGSTGVPSIVPTAASGGGLEFYKEVHVGVLNVSGWDLYFDGLLRAGAVNFMLDGYMVRNNEILKWLHRDWDKSRFMSLKKRVQAKGGKILATLYDNLDHNYQYDIDRDIFLSNARKFLQAYPVDGFCLTYGGSSEEQVFYIRELITAFQELGKISMTKYSHFTWNFVERLGMIRITRSYTEYQSDNKDGNLISNMANHR